MRIAMFDDHRVGVVGNDDKVVDATDLVRRYDGCINVVHRRIVRPATCGQRNHQ